jgi:hypothetical protein
MRSATRRGQLSIAELVDAQHVEWGPVRDLFVDYLHERALGLDYSTLVALVSKIVRLFWRDLEVHEPGIDSLHLSDDVAQRWKQRLREVRHGRQRIGQPRQDLAADPTSQTVTPITMRERTSSQPPSMNWNDQNRLAGW